MEGASRDAENLPVLRKQIGSLDEVLGRTKSRDSFDKRLRQTRKDIQSLKSDLDTARKQQKSSADELGRRESALDKANKDLASVGYDPELDHALDEVRNDATALTAVRDAVATNSAEADAAANRAKREKESVARAAEGTRKAAERMKPQVNGYAPRQLEMRHINSTPPPSFDGNCAPASRALCAISK